MEHLTNIEKKMITQMKETSSDDSDFYYDNPSCAKEDVKLLLKIVERLMARLSDIE